jgi:hypothetical protein
MSKLSEQLQGALRPAPPDSNGLLVKLMKLTNEDYPGRDAHGVLPLVVVGHEALREADWRRWLKEHAASAYGVAFADKLSRTGVDLKEMLPTAPIGRAMRETREVGRWRFMPSKWRPLEEAGAILTMVEKWPSLYNTIAEEMAEEEMTLRQFVDRVYALPSPFEVGEGRMFTLGDLIGRGMTQTPSY